MRFKDRLDKQFRKWKQRENLRKKPLTAVIDKEDLSKATSLTASAMVDEFLPYLDFAYSKLSSDLPGIDLPKLVPPDLVFAMIDVESKGNKYAIRYEPTFYAWLVARLRGSRVIQSGLITHQTEMTTRSMSFGLMQIMGETARNEGFKGIYLTELCDPSLNLYYGIKYFYRQRVRYGGLDAAVAAYNAGSAVRLASGSFRNQVYVDKVKRARQEFSGIFARVRA